jgi:hypothetical protein
MSFKIKSYRGALRVNINVLVIHCSLKLLKLVIFLFTTRACVIITVIMEFSIPFLMEPLLLPTSGKQFTKCQLFLHKQIIPYPQLAKMQRSSVFVDDAPMSGKHMLRFAKGAKFLPAGQMRIRTHPRKVCYWFSVVHPLEIQLLGGCF